MNFYCMTDEPNGGMSLKQMEARFYHYCSRYGITMYYKKYQPSHVKGWHVMNVCDVDGEDTATVVSWGRKYTLKLAELKKDCKFMWVRYRV